MQILGQNTKSSKKKRALVKYILKKKRALDKYISKKRALDNKFSQKSFGQRVLTNTLFIKKEFVYHSSKKKTGWRIVLKVCFL